MRSLDYNLRSQIDFSLSSLNTTDFSLNSLLYFASKVWNMVPLELKILSDVEIFKFEIRKYKLMQYDSVKPGSSRIKVFIIIIIIELILLLLILLLSDFPEVCPLETYFQNTFWVYLPPYLFH